MPAPLPALSEERIGSLDFIRGIAILLILFINIEVFCYPDSFSPFRYGFATALDQTVRFWVYFLVQGKAIDMLSLLFGAGFYLFIQRLEQKAVGVRALDLYGRRLIFLFLFGAAHAYLVWDGDILYHYGICGFFLIPFRSLPVRQLLLVLLVPVTVLCINLVVFTGDTIRRQQEYVQLAHKDSSLRSEAENRQIKEWVQETSRGVADTAKTEAVRKTYAESIRENAKVVKLHMGNIVNRGILFRTFIMMILGIVLCKSAVFRNYRAWRRYWPFTFFLLLLGLLFNFHRYGQGTYRYFKPILSFAQAFEFLFAKEILALAYVLLFNGLYQRFFSKGSSWIRNIGKTALSNYILQSILCGLIFYGYGLGYYNKVSRSGLLLVIAAVWSIQLVLSGLWLRYHAQGPLEALWRRLIYGKANPDRSSARAKS
ncbi:MAG: DUF418 domain-containing protein [Chitinophagaceae bacterium]|nr:DUF418 domain-containing protein [Chitinophagaceae bacterium]